MRYVPCQQTLRSVLLAIGACFAVGASADDSFGLASIQNDVFFDRDGGGYTNGIFLGKVRLASNESDGAESALLFRPLTEWLDLPQPTLAATSLSQMMVTPRDIDLETPQPDDTPYVGRLALRTMHVYVREDIADMLALNLGVIGPAAGAEQTQRFIHRLIDADEPRGWDSQGGNRTFFSVEGFRAWRFVDESTRPNADFIAIAGGTAGNRETSLGISLLARYGTGLARSFPTTARVVGRTGDPIAVASSWFAYAGISADRVVSKYGIGSNAPGNDTRLRKSQAIPVLGIAYGWADSSLSFSLQMATPLTYASRHRQAYGSLTYAFRL